MRIFITLIIAVAVLCGCAPATSHIADQDITLAYKPDNYYERTIESIPPVIDVPPAALQQIMPEEVSGEPPEDSAVSPRFLFELMEKNREKFARILDDPERYEVQILLTEIVRDEEGQPSFKSFAYGVDKNKYFYPASTVKMAIAALALQKINALEGANRQCVLNVANSKNGGIGRGGFTVEKYIHRMITISDNIAYNRLYDFLGQEYINETLHAMGYVDCQIVRRFNSQTSAASDRVNYPCELRTAAGVVVYSRPAIVNENIYTLKERDDMSGLLRGRGAKAFYDYNYMSLEVMQQILLSLIFPLSAEPGARFNIAEDDREFLLECMRGENTLHKYFIYGGQGKAKPYIEIYNKTGTSYGNILDNAYIVDAYNNIEFLLTAVIYVNSNGVIGDDVYDYERIGMPFLKELGRMLYNHYWERYYGNEKFFSQGGHNSG